MKRVLATMLATAALLAAPSTARATNVTLRLVDQNGVEIPGSQFWVDGSTRGQDEAVVLTPGQWPVELIPAVRGAPMIGLYRTGTISVGTADTTLIFTWRTAALHLRLVEQNAIELQDAHFSVYTEEMRNGETVVLPVTRDPTSSGAAGSLANGYQIQVMPPVGGHPTGQLFRVETVSLSPVGLDTVLVWRYAPVRLRLVDQTTAPVDSGLFSIQTAGDFISGQLTTLPVTFDPLQPNITSTFANDGYQIGVYPPIGNRRQGGPLVRFEQVRIGPSGLDTAFVWRYAPVRLRLVDQNAATVDSGFFDMGIAGEFMSGASTLVPVTFDPLQPNITSTFADAGYLVGVYPPIGNRRQGGPLVRFEHIRVGPAGLDTAFVWRYAPVRLHLVDQNAATVDSGLFTIDVAGDYFSGQSILLPVTDDPSQPNITSTLAETGYEIGVFPPIGRRSQGGPLVRREHIRLGPAGLDTAFVWRYAPVRLRLVDQNAATVDSGFFGMDIAGEFMSGASTLVPVTFDPLQPNITSTLADAGYVVGVYPPIGNRRQGGPLVRFEHIRVGPAGLDTAFVWRYAPVRLRLVDQNAATVDSGLFTIDAAGDHFSGQSIAMPVTFDPLQPNITSTNADSGYAVWIYPPIAGRSQGGFLLRREHFRLSPSGLDSAFVWPSVSGVLSIVDSLGFQQARSGFTISFIDGSSGTALAELPALYEPTSSSLPTGPYASGYPVSIRPTASSSYSGPYMFALNADGTFSPPFVSIDGVKYGLRFSGTRTLREFGGGAPGESLLAARLDFEDPLGNAKTRGWVGSDRTNLVFAHPSGRFLVNDATVQMDTRALWIGADSVSAAGEVANWVQSFGCGNDWSQRVVSPAFDGTAHATAVLRFDAQLALGGGPLRDAVASAAFVAAQAETASGRWAFLSTRWQPEGTSAIVSSALAGRGVLHAEAWLGADGNEALHLPASARVRLVVQTADSANADARWPQGPGVVLDNLSLRDGATDVVSAANFEDGSTGGWTLSALNGAANVHATRDVAPPQSNVTLKQAVDAVDPSWVWTFRSPGDTLAAGTDARLESPWTALADSSRPFGIALEGRLNVRAQERALVVRVLAKHAGDARPFLSAPLPYAFFGGDGAGDQESPWSSGTAATFPTDFGLPTSLRPDSVKLVFEVQDRGDNLSIAAGRPSTSLPVLDRISLYQVGIDRDHDGVPDCRDHCPDIPSSGQDAYGTGCPDATSTMRHEETWRYSELPIHWAISQSALPGVSDGSDATAVRAAFSEWQSVQGANVPTTEDARSALVHANALDGVNLVTFEDDIGFPPGVWASTPTTSFTHATEFDDRIWRPGEIVDADVILNPNVPFHTASSGTPSGFDLQSVATHEFGHLLGLTHSGVAKATMYPVIGAGTDAASLELDDDAALAAAYPAVDFASSFGTIRGRVTRGSNGQPVPGALVLAVPLVGGVPVDTVASDFTDEHGVYGLRRLPPGAYAVRVQPLDGSIPGVIPAAISERVAASAQVDFPAEWYSAPEAASDDPSVWTPLAVGSGEFVDSIYVVTNIDQIPPQVVRVLPVADTTGVRVDTAILVDFSEAVFPDSLARAFRLVLAGDTARVAGRGQLLSGGQRFVFVPAQALAYDTTYTLTITTSLHDAGGVGLASPYVARFRTEVRSTIAISGLNPSHSPVGGVVTILGSGFDPANAGAMTVRFAGCPSCDPIDVPVLSSTANALTIRVPDGARSGPVSVRLNNESSLPDSIAVLPDSMATLLAMVPVPVPLYAPPSDLVLSRDGRWVFVATSSGIETVSLDPLAGTAFMRSTAHACGPTARLALAPDGRELYLLQPQYGRVAIVDANATSGSFGEIVALFPVPGFATGADGRLAVSRDGTRLVVCGPVGDSLAILDVSTQSIARGQLVSRLSVPGAGGFASLSFAASGTIIAATRSLRVLAIAPQSDSVTILSTESPGAATYYGAQVAPDDSTIVLARVPFERPQGIATQHASWARKLSPASTLETTTSGHWSVVAPIDASSLALSPNGGTYYANHFATLWAFDPNHGILGNLALPAVAMAIDEVGSTLVAIDGGASPALRIVSARLSSAGSQAVRPSLGPATTPAIGVPGDLVTVSTDIDASAPGGSLIVGGSNVPIVATDTAGVAFRVPAGPALVAPVSFTSATGARSTPTAFQFAGGASSTSPRLVSRQPSSTQFASSGMAVSPSGDQFAILETNPVAISLWSATRRGDGALDHPLARILLPTGASSLTYNHDGRSLWVASYQKLMVVDTDPHSAAFGGLATVQDHLPVDWLWELTIDPLSGGPIASGYGVIARFNRDGTLRDTLSFEPNGAYALAAARDGRTLVAAGEDRVWFYDMQTGRVSASSTPRPDALDLLVLSSDGRAVASWDESGNVGVWNLDPTRGPIGVERFHGPLPIAAGVPYTYAACAGPDPASVLIAFPDQDSISVLDLASPTPAVTKFAAVPNLQLLKCSPDRRQLWGGLSGFNNNFAPDTLVQFDMSAPTHLAQVQGGSQLGAPGASLAQPIRVRVFDAANSPVTGAVVRFEPASAADGHLEDASAGSAVQIVTDASGAAAANWTLPEASGSYHVSVTLPGVVDTVVFSATAVQTDSAAAPVILAFGPAPGSPPLDVASPVYVRFSKAMDSTSVAQRLGVSIGGSAIAGRYELQDSGRLMIFRPSTGLPHGARGQLELASGALDSFFHTLADSLRIEFTVEAAQNLSLDAITPTAAPSGASLVITGRGFSASPAQNVVFVNGVPAPVLTVAENGLIARVPLGATSGDVWVKVGAAESNRISFHVLQRDTSGSTVQDSILASQGMRDLAITPDGARAYVTNPTLNTVFAVRIDSLKVFALIPVGIGPEAIALWSGSTPRAYVANRGGGDVSVIDISGPGSPSYHRVIGTIPVGADPVAVAVSAVGPRVFVACQGNGSLSVIDARASSATFHQVVATVNTGSGTKGVVITPDGGRAVVATAGGLVIVDVASRAVVATVNTGSGTKGVVITPDGTLALALTDDGRLVLVVLATGPQQYQVVATVNTGSGTKGIVITPDGTTAYVTLTTGNAVLVFRISGGTLSRDGSSTGAGASATATDTLAVGRQPEGIGLSPQGGFALVANSGDGTVTLLNVPGAPALVASVTAHPSPILLTPRFNRVSVSLRMPLPYRSSQVELGSVVVGGSSPWPSSASLTADGALSLDVRRDRLMANGSSGDSTFVTCTGQVNGRPFVAQDSTALRRVPITQPGSGQVLAAGARVIVRWTPTTSALGARASLLQSLDGGASWTLVGGLVADLGQANWQVPANADSVVLAVVESDSVRADTLAFGRAGIVGPLQVVRVTSAPPDAPRFALEPLDPNPARDVVRVRWSLARAGDASLEVFDLAGRRVRMLAHGPQDAGPHDSTWRGENARGEAVGAGVFFVRLRMAGEEAVRRVVLLR